MSSRNYRSDRDRPRRDRSWERNDRDRDTRGGDRDNKGGDRDRDRGGRGGDRDRDRYPRSSRRRSSRSASPRRNSPVGRDRRRDYSDRDFDSRRDDGRDRVRRDRDRDDERARREPPSGPSKAEDKQTRRADESSDVKMQGGGDSGAPDDVQEDEDPDAAMMAMMGLSGFGTTKNKAVTGNQEGGADIKKTRTWRQYMNRRGGFNRPLDKIK
ncbi:DUF1777-domain-containing protein [Cylindrobasidium torrendii FP15055 ss-10]|uniref:DUF1777-domain-containing protein n=1 Tax=Cylindrobasidium torrendii FP15055 ss-10 TaxID=1314674 RepID=A0A0D7BG58_9AGAR|nr:DUF1777-domain-containing protein [Cylindrobasidium torrendii FP15055 ss-10]